MARISYLRQVELEGKAKDIYDGLPIKLNLALMLCHSPTLAGPFLRLGSAILTQSKIPPILRELLIVRTAHLTNSEYELSHHILIAKAVGVDDATLALFRSEGGRDKLSPDKSLIFDLATEIAHSNEASEATILKCSQLFGDEILIEMVVCASYYLMVSRFLKSLAIDIDKGRQSGGVDIS